MPQVHIWVVFSFLFLFDCAPCVILLFCFFHFRAADTLSLDWLLGLPPSVQNLGGGSLYSAATVLLVEASSFENSTVSGLQVDDVNFQQTGTRGGMCSMSLLAVLSPTSPALVI